MDKTLATAAEAVAGIGDGATVMIGGFGGSGAPIELMLRDFDIYRTIRLDYRGGLRYPHLERIEGKPDTLTPMLTARK